MDYTKFIKFVSKLNDFPLPGKKAQFLAVPTTDRLKRLSKKKLNIKKVKKAAVLIYCYPNNDKMYFSLIKRSDYNGVHSGQISLPGGKLEKYDKSLKETAIRECNEELGISIDFNKELFPLTPLYVPPSNFLVSPYIAHESFYPIFNPNSSEVALHIELSINQLMKLRIEKKKINDELDADSKIRCYIHKEHIIWGATAMILSEFKFLLASSKLN